MCPLFFPQRPRVQLAFALHHPGGGLRLQRHLQLRGAAAGPLPLAADAQAHHSAAREKVIIISLILYPIYAVNAETENYMTKCMRISLQPLNLENKALALNL